MKPSSAKQRKNEARSDPAISYNDFKEFEGQQYTGMKIGRRHKWYCDRGESRSVAYGGFGGVAISWEKIGEGQMLRV